MPPKKRKAVSKTPKPALKRKRESSLTPSEQEILDALPPAGDLARPIKNASSLVPGYLVYTLFDTGQAPRAVVRRVYESRYEALAAFQREYTMWTTGKEGAYEARHTQEQFKSSYLTNIMDMNKEKDAGTKIDGGYPGRGKVSYPLVHKDDLRLQDNDPKKRTCTVICEETVFEKTQ